MFVLEEIDKENPSPKKNNKRLKVRQGKNDRHKICKMRRKESRKRWLRGLEHCLVRQVSSSNLGNSLSNFFPFLKKIIFNNDTTRGKVIQKGELAVKEKNQRIESSQPKYIRRDIQAIKITMQCPLR